MSIDTINPEFGPQTREAAVTAMRDEIDSLASMAVCYRSDVEFHDEASGALISSAEYYGLDRDTIAEACNKGIQLVNQLRVLAPELVVA